MKKFNFSSASTCLQKSSKCLDIGSTEQTSTSSEKPTSSCENLKKSSVNVQRPRLSLIPIAPPITPAIIPRPIQIFDPSDKDPPSFPIQPWPLKKDAARKKGSSTNKRHSTQHTFSLINVAFLLCKVKMVSHPLLKGHLISKLSLT